MLTGREYDQITAALTMSTGHRINGDVYIHLDNALALLQRYLEPDPTPEAVPESGGE